jgi:hypothetical protein
MKKQYSIGRKSYGISSYQVSTTLANWLKKIADVHTRTAHIPIKLIFPFHLKQNWNSMRVCVRMYVCLQLENRNQSAPNLACLSLETSQIFWNGRNSERLSWIRVPERVVPVARERSTIEERRQDQSCLVGKGDYSNKGHNPEKSVLRSSPDEDKPVARKLSTIEQWCQEHFFLLRQGDYRNKGKKPEKTALGFSPGEDTFCTLEINSCRR